MDAIREWRTVELPDAVRKVVTMLAIEERQLLYALDRDHWTGAGAIVDAGCFLGGSTLALGTGVMANPRPVEKRGVIHSYDLFVADAHQAGKYLKKFGTFAPGDSVRPIFDFQTRDVAPCVHVHEGDVQAFPWNTGTPIEVLFIDVSKTWGINDFLARQFFPMLMPGHSIVVQQDYVHPTCPWLAVTMEYLADYFEPVAYVPGNSMVYTVTKPIPVEVVDGGVISSLPGETKRTLMDQAVARCAGVFAASRLGRSGGRAHTVDPVDARRRRGARGFRAHPRGLCRIAAPGHRRALGGDPTPRRACVVSAA